MELPFIDEHEVLVAAPPSVVWPVLVEQVERGLSLLAPLAGLLGAVPSRASGRFGVGATVPGFEVAEVVPERLVRLTGRHRFSRYELAFTLAPSAGGTRLAARSLAEFPGPQGFLYRTLVITSGGHRLAVARLLRTVSRRACRP